MKKLKCLTICLLCQLLVIASNNGCHLQSPECVIPDNGDWHVTEDCTLSGDSGDFKGNVIVENGAVLTVGSQGILNVDNPCRCLIINFASGGSVKIMDGGKLLVEDRVPDDEPISVSYYINPTDPELSELKVAVYLPSSLEEDMPLVIRLKNDDPNNMSGNMPSCHSRIYTLNNFVFAAVQIRAFPGNILGESPVGPWPAQLEDLKKAIKFFTTRAYQDEIPGAGDDWTIDPENIGLIGYSFSGQLVTLAAVLDNAPVDSSPKIKAVYASAPIANMMWHKTQEVPCSQDRDQLWKINLNTMNGLFGPNVPYDPSIYWDNDHDPPDPCDPSNPSCISHRKLTWQEDTEVLETYLYPYQHDASSLFYTPRTPNNKCNFFLSHNQGDEWVPPQQSICLYRRLKAHGYNTDIYLRKDPDPSNDSTGHKPNMIFAVAYEQPLLEIPFFKKHLGIDPDASFPLEKFRDSDISSIHDTNINTLLDDFQNTAEDPEFRTCPDNVLDCTGIPGDCPLLPW